MGIVAFTFKNFMTVKDITYYLLNPSNFFVFFILSYFLAPYRVELIQVSPSSIVLLLISLFLLFNFKINDFKNKFYIVPSVLVLILLSWITFAEIKNLSSFEITSTFRSYIISVVAFWVLLLSCRGYTLQFHRKIYWTFSLFLFFSGILSYLQYLGLDFSPASFLYTGAHDRVGSGFASYPQSNAGLICLALTFCISSIVFLRSFTRSFNKIIYSAAYISLGIISLLNTHNKSLFLSLFFYSFLLLIFMLFFQDNNIRRLKRLFFIFLVSFSSVVTLLSYYSLTANANSQVIFKNFDYFTKELYSKEYFLSKFSNNIQKKTLLGQNIPKKPLLDQERSANSRLETLFFACIQINKAFHQHKKNFFFGFGSERFIHDYKNYRQTFNEKENLLILDDHSSIPLHNFIISFTYSFGLIGVIFLITILIYPFFLKKKNIFFIANSFSFLAVNFWMLFQANLHERLFWITLAIFYSSLSCTHSLFKSTNDNS